MRQLKCNTKRKQNFKMMKNVFVTVGTTEFNELIERLAEPSVLEILNSLGCQKLTLQIGRGKEVEFNSEGIKVDSFTLKETIADDIERADLIISHAGAGTCIDVLTRGKPLVVVINDTLMNNHQTELAEQLSNDGYLFQTTVQNLPETLRNIDTSKLKSYEQGNVDKFIEYLDNAMGFSQ